MRIARNGAAAEEVDAEPRSRIVDENDMKTAQRKKTDEYTVDKTAILRWLYEELWVATQA
ncbi:hypothetical protein A0H81_10230 [Grifola frondosa]|uniref:Uncharacterized protein n=1 Tax=Grifola frondosa TaxID=5627 RepID=A0A1C7LYW9_GRIFR|nr:hypothetical protein A0H81_10230 [Grifola frondosa]